MTLDEVIPPVLPESPKILHILGHLSVQIRLSIRFLVLFNTLLIISNLEVLFLQEGNAQKALPVASNTASSP